MRKVLKLLRLLMRKESRSKLLMGIHLQCNIIYLICLFYTLCCSVSFVVRYNVKFIYPYYWLSYKEKWVTLNFVINWYASDTFLGRWKMEHLQGRKRNLHRKMLLVVLYLLKNNLKSSKMLQGTCEHLFFIEDFVADMLYSNISKFFQRWKHLVFLFQFLFCGRT